MPLADAKGIYLHLGTLFIDFTVALNWELPY